jgi:diguanylate cyclase (GGDEF)-like protein
VTYRRRRNDSQLRWLNERVLRRILVGFGVQRLSRIATAGLAVCLTLMAAFTMHGLHSSTTETAKAKHELELSSAYADVENSVLEAKRAQRDYLEAHLLGDRGNAAAAYRHAQAGLLAATDRLRLGGDQDRALASYIGIEQRRFDDNTRRLFADVALGHVDTARTLERTTLRSALDTLESLVTAASTSHRERAENAMRQLTERNRRAVRTVGALFGVCFAFLVGCWALLLLLQRELQQTATEHKHRADHDGLTGLPNRTLFYVRAHAAVDQSAIEGTRASLLLLDLDHFKPVNDQFGHHTGDELLKQVGVRLVAELRSNDTAARLGGDEFGVVLPDTNPQDLPSILDRLCHAIALPYEIDGQVLTISTSVGAATWPASGQNVDDLLRAADAAMYLAKQARCGWRVANPPAPPAGRSKIASSS